MKKNIAQWIDQIIADNRMYIIENDQTVAEYLLGAGEGIESVANFLSEDDDDAIAQAEDSNAKQNELVAEIVSYIKENYNYKLNSEDFE